MSITTPWQYCPIIREVTYLDHSKQVYLQGVTESLTEYPILPKLHGVVIDKNEDSELYNQDICWNESFLVLKNPYVQN
jgi:hypothetical protein